MLHLGVIYNIPAAIDLIYVKSRGIEVLFSIIYTDINWYPMNT